MVANSWRLASDESEQDSQAPTYQCPTRLSRLLTSANSEKCLRPPTSQSNQRRKCLAITTTQVPNDPSKNKNRKDRGTTTQEKQKSFHKCGLNEGCYLVSAYKCRLTKKAEPPPTRDVNRDSGTASANGGWLRRLVRRTVYAHALASPE